MADHIRIQKRGFIISIDDKGITIKARGVKEGYFVDWEFLDLQFKHEVEELRIMKKKVEEGLRALFG